MIPIHIDFETRSATDLKKSSTHAYACHPSTDAWCMAYAIGDNPPEIWTLGQPFPQAILNFVKSGKPYYFIAHNAYFELLIWNYLCVPKYGWPPLHAHRTYCTMAMAYAMALPGSLENAANATGLADRKDMEGRSLMIKMASPRRVNPDGTYLWWDDEASRNRLYDYCKNDVVVERALEKRLQPLSENERKVWLLDYAINNRGVRVDRPAITKGLETIMHEKIRLNYRMDEATKNMVPGTTSLVDLKDFIRFHGVSTDGLDKPAIRKALQGDLPTAVRLALKLRQEGAKASTAKLQTMLEGASPDGRVRGNLQYHGAGTGRWAGRRIQPQNMPRGELKLTPQDVEDVIEHLDQPDYLSAFYGPPLTVISDIVRGLIIPDPGNDFIVVDFNAIEARVLAWLAGQQSTLDVFNSGQDIYKHAAAAIFGTFYDSVTEAERQVGKTAILALGYQGGVPAFDSMAKTYNVDMTPAYPELLKTSTEKQRQLSLVQWRQYVRKHIKNPPSKEQWEEMSTDDITTLARQDPELISFEVFIASELTKRLWREANPDIQQYWGNLEAAAKAATLANKTIYVVQIPGDTPHRQIKFVRSGSFLWCRLPSGRRLCYPFPEIREIIPPWEEEGSGNTKPTLTYMGVDKGVWKRQKAYGGMLAENITQAVARDLLVEAMFTAEAAGYPVVLHVHDELVTEAKKTFGSLKELEEITSKSPAWAPDLPIVSKGWRGARYRK